MILRSGFLGQKASVVFAAPVPRQATSAPRQLTTCMAKKKGELPYGVIFKKQQLRIQLP